ncbi:15685_t:CDS:2 [Dentiscutata heterogama]|uniref:15685_t:CDS:1 n=1 Tax=Dentiscutata heterogama TaxID=1316150 RepID=A0ACA9NK75_9GLOM|nr:15685_t:CDS:2 [Dentiscutata heterogama]
MPRNRIDLTPLDRRIKNEVSENFLPSRSYPIQATSYSDEREYSRTSRHTRRDSRSRDRYYSRNDSYDRNDRTNVSRDYSYRSRRSPYRGHRSRSRSRGRSFRDYFTRYKDHYSPDYRRNHRSPEYRRSNRNPEYQKDNYLHKNQDNHSPHPVIKQEDQIDSTYVQFLTRQIYDLTCQIQAMQAERSGTTQVITPISTDDGAKIRHTTDRQQIRNI